LTNISLLLIKMKEAREKKKDLVAQGVIETKPK
jgi:hypothetical protein